MRPPLVRTTPTTITRTVARTVCKHSVYLAGALMLLPTDSRAQTFPVDDPTIKRIYRIGMDSSQAMKLGQTLLDSIGPRLTGTAMQKGAGDWLVSLYKSWGVDARQEQSGTWRGWRRGHSHIDLLTPRVRTLEGTMLAWSPGTGSKDVTASTVILPKFEDSSAFVRWLPQAKGKFVLISPAMPTCRPTDNWAAFASPESKVAMDSLRLQTNREWAARVAATGYSLALGSGSLGVRLEAAGIAGVVTSRPKNAWGTIDVFESYNKIAPAIALSCEDYGLLYRLTENNQSPTLRINTDAEVMGEVPIYNTVGVIRGTELPDEYVLLSAHFDSFDGGSGATDNGTGTLTMLEAMRIIAEVLPKPKRSIMIGHWTAEEHGLVGSRAFSEDHPEVREGLQALFNQDNGTGRIQTVNGGGLVSGGEHLEKWVAMLPTEISSKLTVRNPGSPSSGGSDDASFSCWGLPAFGLGGVSWDYGNYTWHTNRDTFDKVVFDDIRHNATLTAMLAYLASESPTRVGREKATLTQRTVAGGRAGGAGAGGAGAAQPTSFAPWPTCQKAPRSTNPRLR